MSPQIREVVDCPEKPDRENPIPLATCKACLKFKDIYNGVVECTGFEFDCAG